MKLVTTLGRHASHRFITFTLNLFRQRNRMAFSPDLSLPEPQPGQERFAPDPRKRVWTGEEIFALDVRSLALFRISVALVILMDLYLRAFDLAAHYTDFGLLPRPIAITEYATQGLLSLHFLGGGTLSQIGLFFIAACCAAGLLLGYRTRLMTILSWLLLVSLHNRNPMVLDAGDVLLRLLLFWAMFLPLGATYSLDGVLTPPVRAFPERVRSIGTIALILQICFVYWFTVALKHDPVWRTEGSAVYYALNLDSFATPFGLWLRQFPTVLPLLSFATLIIEAIGPCLLFLPIFHVPLRFFAVCMFLGLHIGFALCLDLGIFPFIVGAAWLALLPSWFWNSLTIPTDLSVSRKFTLQHRLEGWLGKTRYLRVAAAAHPPLWRPTVSTLFCVLCLVYIFCWNLRTVDFARYSTVFPVGYNWFGHTLRIDQMWGMFAPKPASDDGWYVIPARLRDGSVMNLMTDGGPIAWEKPVHVAATYRNQRWRKYLRNVWEQEHSHHRLYFGQYLCRDWNARHAGALTLATFEIFYVKEETLPNGEIASPERVLLWSHRCF